MNVFSLLMHFWLKKCLHPVEIYPSKSQDLMLVLKPAKKLEQRSYKKVLEAEKIWETSGFLHFLCLVWTFL